MRYLFSTLITALLLISCNNKIVADGPIVTKEISVAPDASSISVRSATDLVLSDEVAEGVILVATNENILEYVDVVADDEQIKIELDNDNSYKNLDLRVTASAKQFNAIEASGASHVEIKGDNIEFDTYSINLSGASSLEAQEEVKTTDCNITASGASSVKGRHIATNNLKIKLSGASNTEITAINTITGELSGASTLTYWGTATHKVELKGGSKVVARERVE